MTTTPEDTCVPLPADWDGDGAAPITEATAQVAREALPELARRYGPVMTCFPTPAGSILVTWQRENGDYLECEVIPSGMAEFMEIPAGAEARHWDERLPLQPINP